MPGTYSKAYTAVTGDTITAARWNTEHDNHINNCDFSGLGDYSVNTAQMQSTADPYPAAVESLATDGKGELERLRYQVLGILQALADDATQWYHDAPTTGTFKIGIVASNEVAVTINNSTGAGSILICNDNGSARLTVPDSTENPLILNATSANGPYIRLQESGTNRWSLGHDLGQVTDAFVIRDETNSKNQFFITTLGSIVNGSAAIATNATDGFVYIPACAGTPTGAPTSFTGRVALVADSTNHKLYFYDGAWRDVGP